MKATIAHLDNPFEPSSRRVIEQNHSITIRDHLTIEGYLTENGEDKFLHPTVCCLNGEPLMRSEWDYELVDGDVVTFVPMPMGGDGQSTGKLILAAVIMIAVIVIAPYASAYLVNAGYSASMAAGVTAVGVAAVGVLVNTFLLAPELPSAERKVKTGSFYGIGSKQNQTRIGEPVMVGYGRHKIIPDHIAQQYTEYEGQTRHQKGNTPPPGSNDAKQMQYSLMCIGQGEYSIEEVAVGSVVVSNDGVTSIRPEVEFAVIEPGDSINATSDGDLIFPGARAVSTTLGSVELEGPEDSQGLIPNEQTRGQIFPGDIDTSCKITNIDKTTDPNNHRITVELKAGGTLPAISADEFKNMQLFIGNRGTIDVGNKKDYDNVAYSDFDAGAQGSQTFQEYEFAQEHKTTGGTISNKGSLQPNDGYWAGRASDDRQISPAASTPYQAHHEALVHPTRLYDIKSNTAANGTSDTSIIIVIYGQFHSGTYYGQTFDTPDDTYANNGIRSECHVRQDYEGPHVINAPGTTIRRAHFDVGGPPQFYTHNGRRYRVGIGLRPEVRAIDDNGDPTGPWLPLPIIDGEPEGSDKACEGPAFRVSWDGYRWRQWLAGNWNGRVRSRRATFGLWGPSTQNPVRLTFTAAIPEGRYEGRMRRTTFRHESNRKHAGYYSAVTWMGLRGTLTLNKDTYQGVTTAVSKVTASADINRNAANYFNVIATRKLRQWGRANSAFDLTGFLNVRPSQKFVFVNTDPNDDYLTDTDEGVARGHGLVTGQQITISGQSGSIGGIPDSEINGTHTVTVTGPFTFEFSTTTSPTSASANSGSANIAFDSSPYWSAVQATRNPVWAIIDMATQGSSTNRLTGQGQYGGSLSDNQLDLNAFSDIAILAEIRNDYYDVVFEDTTTLLQAMNAAARAVRSRVVFNGQQLTIVRDRAQTTYKAMFTDENMVKGSFQINYEFLTDNSPNAVYAEYINEDTWKPDTVKAYLPAPEPGDKPSRIRLNGIVNQDHAMREATYLAAVNRYQREKYTFTTELEGLLVGVGDLINISHPIMDWNQTGLLSYYDESRDVLVADKDLDWNKNVINIFDEVDRDSSFEGDLTTLPTGWLVLGSNTTGNIHRDRVREYHFQDSADVLQDLFERGDSVFYAENSGATWVYDEPVDSIGRSTAKIGTGVGVLTYTGDTSTKRFAGLQTDGIYTTDASHIQYGILEVGQVWECFAWVRARNTQAVGKSIKIFMRQYSPSAGGGFDDGTQNYENTKPIGGSQESFDCVLTTEWQFIRCRRNIEYSDITQLRGYVQINSTNSSYRFNVEGAAGAQGQEEIEIGQFVLGLAPKSRKAHSGRQSLVLYKGATGAQPWSWARINLSPPELSGTVDPSSFNYKASFWVKANDIAGDQTSAQNKQITLIVRCQGAGDPLENFILQYRYVPTDAWVYIEGEGSPSTTNNIDQVEFMMGYGGSTSAAENTVVWFDEPKFWRAGDYLDHSLIFKLPDGSVHGPLTVTRGNTDREMVLPGSLPDGKEPIVEWYRTKRVDGDDAVYEPATFAFGNAEVWQADALVTGIQPRGTDKVEISAVNYAPEVYTADGTLAATDAISPIPYDAEDIPEIRELDVSVLGAAPNVKLRCSWTDAPGAEYYELQTGHDNEGKLVCPLLASVPVRGPISRNDTFHVYGPEIYDSAENETQFNSNIETVNTQSMVRISWFGHPFVNGDVITVVGGAVAIGGIPADDWTGRSHVVQNVIAGFTFEIPVATAATSVEESHSLLTICRRHEPDGTVCTLNIEQDGFAGVNSEEDQDLIVTITAGDLPIDPETGDYSDFAVYIQSGGNEALLVGKGMPTPVSTEFASYSGGKLIQNQAEVDVLMSDEMSNEIVDADNEIPNYVETADVSTYPRTGTIPIAVRVRGVGKLYGPWNYTTVQVPLSETPQALTMNSSGVTYRSTSGGFGIDNSDEVALVNQSKTFWIEADNAATPTTETIGSITVPKYHIVDRIEIEILEAWNANHAVHSIVIGRGADPDAYIETGFWNATDGELQDLGYRIVEKNDGAFTGDGVDFNSVITTEDTITCTYVRNASTSDTGKARVTVYFRVLDVDPYA